MSSLLGKSSIARTGVGGLWEYFGAVPSPKIVLDHCRDSDCKRPGLACQPGLFLSPLWNQSQWCYKGETILLLRDMQKGAKFSLKEEATAPQGPLGQNGGCHKQPFAPILCLCAATLTERAGICLLGHSCSCKNRQSVMCLYSQACSGYSAAKCLLWLGAEIWNPCPTKCMARQTRCTIWCVQHQHRTRETGQTWFCCHAITPSDTSVTSTFQGFNSSLILIT